MPLVLNRKAFSANTPHQANASGGFARPAPAQNRVTFGQQPQHQATGQVAATRTHSSGLFQAPNRGSQHLTSSRSQNSKLSENEIELICAMASLQLQHGKAEEAVALLASVRIRHPEHYQTLRLFVVALMKLDRWDEAESMLRQLESMEDSIGSIRLVYRSLIDFKKNRLEQAAHWFRSYLSIQREASAEPHMSHQGETV